MEFQPLLLGPVIISENPKVSLVGVDFHTQEPILNFGGFQNWLMSTAERRWLEYSKRRFSKREREKIDAAIQDDGVLELLDSKPE